MKKLNIIKIIIEFFGALIILIFLADYLRSSYSLVLTTFYQIWDKTIRPHAISRYASVFAFASLYIIIFFSSNNKKFQLLIKILFVVLDVILLAIIYDENILNYARVAAYGFAVYSGLITFFIGSIILNIIDKVKPKKEESNINELKSLKKSFEELQAENKELNYTIDVIQNQLKNNDLKPLIPYALKTLSMSLNMRKDNDFSKVKDYDLFLKFKDFEGYKLINKKWKK